MEIINENLVEIKSLRTEYLTSLPHFQELFLEIQIEDSDIYALNNLDTTIGYAIINTEGVLIEYYIKTEFLKQKTEAFSLLINELSISEIYCKSFDELLVNSCQSSGGVRKTIGKLFRDYGKPLMQTDDNIAFKRADTTSIEFLYSQDKSIHELFESKKQLRYILENHNIYMFYNSKEFIGCGMIILTHTDWNYCDLGVWVKPEHRGNSHGAQILLHLRCESLSKGLDPSCGCAIDNIASQKAIEKSGFINTHEMLHFHLEKV